MKKRKKANAFSSSIIEPNLCSHLEKTLSQLAEKEDLIPPGDWSITDGAKSELCRASEKMIEYWIKVASSHHDAIKSDSQGPRSLEQIRREKKARELKSKTNISISDIASAVAHTHSITGSSVQRSYK